MRLLTRRRFFDGPPPMAGRRSRGLGVVADVSGLQAVLNSGTLNPQTVSVAVPLNGTGGASGTETYDKCSDMATAQALAAAGGGTVVVMPVPQLQNVAGVDKSAAPSCPYIQWPDGSIADPTDLAYYARVPGGVSQAILQAELNSGAGILASDQQGITGQAPNLSAYTSLNAQNPGAAIVSPSGGVYDASPKPSAANMPGETQPAAGASAAGSVPAAGSTASLVAPVSAADSSTPAAAAATADSWLTSSMFGGLPNWALVVGAAAAVWFMGRSK